MQWVEKASLEKIRRLLEVSEQERHCEVLLTLKNLADVRQSSTPYSLPIIPRSLSLEIVEGEHFVTSDLLSLLKGRVPSTGDPEAEASHREQASRVSPVSLTPTCKDSNSASPGPGRDERGIGPARLPLPRKGIGSAPRVLQIRKKGTGWVKSTPRAQVEDFIPWVHLEPSRPSASKEEEEEKEMTGLVDRYATRKRKRYEDAEREADQVKGSNRLPTDGGSEMQAIVISASPEMSSNDQLGPEGIAHAEPRESTPILPVLRWSSLLVSQKVAQAMLSLCCPGVRGRCHLIVYC